MDQKNQSSSEREGNLNPSTEEQSNCQQVQKTRKRKKRHSVNESEWEVNKNKNAREVGEDYHGKKRVDGKWNYKIRKEGRKMKARCCCKSNPNKSKMQRNTITEEDKNNIFCRFWKMPWGEKKLYVDLFVVVHPTSRARDRKDNDTSRRESSYLYFLERNKEKVRVCKTMFLNTLAIGEKAIRNWKNKTESKKVNENEKLDEENDRELDENNDQTTVNENNRSDSSRVKYKKICESRKKTFSGTKNSFFMLYEKWSPTTVERQQANST